MTGIAQVERSLPKLTSKQRDVLALVADNRTSKEIAGLLGISESAVNQRIEIVRARLGGLPRGELARLYRQEFSPAEGAPEETWQKILLPGTAAAGEGAAAEGISSPGLDGSLPVGAVLGDGSQLSAYFYSSEPEWLAREDRPMAIARASAMLAIVAAAIAIAAIVTQLIGPGIAGS